MNRTTDEQELPAPEMACRNGETVAAGHVPVPSSSFIQGDEALIFRARRLRREKRILDRKIGLLLHHSGGRPRRRGAGWPLGGRMRKDLTAT
jgi:hypothetical protein